MPITASTLIELIENTAAAYEENEGEIRKLAEKLHLLEATRDDLRAEEQGYRLALARRFPDATTASAEEPSSTGLFPLEDGIDRMSRADAVQIAVRLLSRGSQGFATPASIEEFLRERGRTDSRDAIGAALAYLNRNSRVANVGRGQWRLTEVD